MADTYEHFDQFDQRLHDISKNARRRGRRNRVATKFDRDGYIVSRQRRRVRLPWKGLLLLAAGFMVLKAALIIDQGEPAYAEKIAAFAAQGEIERVSAWAFQVDPVSRWLASEYQARVK